MEEAGRPGGRVCSAGGFVSRNHCHLTWQQGTVLVLASRVPGSGPDSGTREPHELSQVIESP